MRPEKAQTFDRLEAKVRRIGEFLWGATLFVAAQMYLFSRWHPPTDWRGENMGWFLNSSSGILGVGAVLLVGGAALGVKTRRNAMRGVLAMSLGATIALAIVLFAIGGSNLFPIVIVVAGFVCVVAIAAGMGITLLLKNLFGRPAVGTPRN